MDWLINNIGTIVVAVVVAAIVGLIVFNRVRKKKNGQSTCGCGCSDCPMKNKCH